MAHLITGHAGIEHIKPSDDGAFNIGIFGQNQFVFPIGEQFGYEIISNNLIKIKSGELVNHGRHINIPVNNYDEVTIENGLQGVKRHDIIVMRYIKNPDTSVESASVAVVKGSSSANPSDPVVTRGNIYEGALFSDMPLYRVILDGLNIEKVECMFTVIPSLPAVNEKAETINNNLTNWSAWKNIPVTAEINNGSIEYRENGYFYELFVNLNVASATAWTTQQLAILPFNIGSKMFYNDMWGGAYAYVPGYSRVINNIVDIVTASNVEGVAVNGHFIIPK